ncbi:MAG: right-handed parallel beta-helix repeat-containing protein [Rhodothermales bacterium]
MRAAVEYANATPGSDTIVFDIPGQPSDVHTIQLLSALPSLSDPVILDATTQGDATCGSPGFNDRLLRIVLDGSLMTTPSDVGFTLADGNSTIQGFVIQRMPQHAINVTSNGNTIRCNYIGTDADGLTAAGNGRLATGAGVFIQAGSTTVTSNVVAANTYDEIRTESGGFNQVTDNFVGINRNADLLPSTDTAINPGNRERIGITTGTNDGVSGNVIGGFFQGIAFGSSNIIRDNLVGIGPSAQSIPNTYGLYSFGNDTQIGQNNTISNNGTGIYIQTANSGNSIFGNSIFGNGAKGILLEPGANDGVVAPTFTSAVIDASGNLAVSFSAPASGTVTFHKADSGASGEGQVEIAGAVNYTAPGTMSTVLGNAAGLSMSIGDFVVGTITDGNNNTSEFSAPLEVVNPLLVTNVADSGQGSLRAAIEYANASSNGIEPETIVFDIPGNGPHTIALLTELTISDPVVLDGITQGDATCGTSPADRVLRIVLESAPAAPNGTSTMRLMPTASGSTIRGLVFGRSLGFGLILDGAGSTTVACNFIGTEANGTTLAEIRDVGLQISAATGNMIGGVSNADGNVITGAVDAALWISGGSGTTVEHNIIGLNKTATAALPPNNGGATGINIVQSPNTSIVSNEIGGFTGVAVQAEGSASPNISFNFIGTNVNRSGTYPNGTGIRLVEINDTVNPPIGTTDATILLNDVTGSTGNAIEVVGTASVRNNLMNNSIYLNGGLAIDLGADGVTPNDAGDVDSGPNSLLNHPENIVFQVGVSGQLETQWTPGTPVNGPYATEFFFVDNNGTGAQTRILNDSGQSTATPSRTYASAAAQGIAVGDRLVASHSEIFPDGNTSEFSPVFTVIGPYTVNNANDSGPGSLRQAILNANANADVNTITFAIPGTGPHEILVTSGDLPTISQPVIIDGFTQEGSSPNTSTFDQGSNAVHAVVVNGQHAVNNGFDVSTATPSTIRGLSITGFLTRTVNLRGNGGHQVMGNYIVTPASSADSWGIWMSSSNNRIGSPAAADLNVIGGYSGNQITIQGSNLTGNIIEYNYIGVDADGVTSIAPTTSVVGGNAGAAISMDATTTGNIFRNNVASGVLSGPAINVGGFENEVRNNIIGAGADGTTAVPNRSGIQLSYNGATNVSSGAIVDGNVVVNSVNEGITARANATTGATISNNRIGLLGNGTAAPNGTHGISLDGTVNSEVSNNVIANNLGNGINVIGSAQRVKITDNAIRNNGGLGVDLAGDGFTGNDAADVDSGPNNLLNYPDGLVARISPSGNLEFDYSTEMAANGPITLEFYEADADGQEGDRFVATSQIGPFASTTLFMDFAVNLGVADGDKIVAIAIDADGNTSEFSPAATVTTEFADPLIVTNTDDSGVGSLRNAIIAANGAGGTPTITFDLSGGTTDVYTIAPLSGLPTITSPLVINGLSQANATCGTTDFTDRALKIVLDGSNLAYDDQTFINPFGLDIAPNTNDVTIQGLVIHSFPGGGIRIDEGNADSVIRCNYIGTDETGTVAKGNFGSGVFVVGYSAVSSGNMIGGPNATDGNLITANAGDEIHFEPGADANTVQHNLIGTESTGTSVLQAPGGYFSTPDLDNFSNAVGIGNNQGASNIIRENVVGGFNEGIQLVSQNDGNRNWGGTNQLLANHIGVARDGTTNLANNSGVSLFGAGIGTELVDGNTIRFNGIGLQMTDAKNSIIRSNDISSNGTGLQFALYGNAALVELNTISDNSGDGILVSNADSGTYRLNTISGNGGHGIRLQDVARFITISGNRIGVDATGDVAVENGRSGISISNSGDITVSQNTISGNTDMGVEIRDGSDLVQLWGNTIGLTQSGDAAAANGIHGVLILESVDNRIGVNGNDPNVISGNVDAGIVLEGTGSTGNTIQGNLIGTDVSGFNSVGNGSDGVRITFGATDNVVGGSLDGRNYISGNGTHGVAIAAENQITTSLVNERNTVSHNVIGLNLNGTAALANGYAGIWVERGSSANTISDNVVSGNVDTGIVLTSGANLNVVTDNNVGLNVPKTAAIGNVRQGLAITDNAWGNRAEGNILSGNMLDGVVLWASGNDNVLRGNFIGTGPAGTGAFGNVGHGILTGGYGETLIENNIIAHNGYNGVFVKEDSPGDAAPAAVITQNSIFSNGGLGIDLLLDDPDTADDDQGDGRNDNDAGDADSGPNGLTNAPVFNWATLNGTNIDLEVFLDTALPATVEVFAADADGAEGQTYLGTATATASNRLLMTVPAGSVQATDLITATVTGPEGTSEFSLAQSVALGSELQFIPDQIVDADAQLSFLLSSDLAAIPGMTDAIAAAIQAWNDVPTANTTAKIAFGGASTSVLPPTINDLQNVVTKSTPQFPLSSNTLAVASKLLAAPQNGQEAEIIEADIIFNADLIGQPGGIGTDLQKEIWDAQAVATHEFGHALGLRHSGVSTATMFFSIPSGTSYRSLEVDDVAWVSHRYPSPSAAGTFGSMSGTIMDGESLSPTPVAGALVVARNADGARVHAYSDADGTFTIPGLPPATYTLRIQPLAGLVDNVPGMTPGTVSPYLRSIANNATFTPETWSGTGESGNEAEDVAEAILVLAGQNTAGIDFTTNLDTTPPTVNGASPRGDRVRTRPEITASFSEPITTANLDFQVVEQSTGTAVPGRVEVPGGTGVIATFTLDTGVDLAFETTYEIRISGATDKKGVVQTLPFTQAFTVRPADNIAPVIVSVSPANGSEGIGTNVTFAVTFDEPMDKTSIPANIALTCVDAAPTVCPTTAAVAGEFSFPTSSQIEGLPGWVAVFKPTSTLLEGATYRLTVGTGVADLTGNSFGTTATYTYTTQANVSPEVVASGPTGTGISVRTSVYADFNERMTLPTGTAAVTLSGPGGDVAGTAELLEDGKRVVFRPDAPLAYMTTYTASFHSSLTDASNPALPIGPFSFAFTTANAPTVVRLESVSPLFAIPGALITLSGDGFSTTKTNNLVAFTAAGGGTVQGIVDSSTLTSLSVIVPEGAVAGPVTVTVGGSSASIDIELYDVLPLVDPAVSRYTTESAPRDVEVTPDGGTAYVTNTGAGSVSVIDVETGDVLKSIDVGDSPLKVVMSPDGARLYVSNFGSHSVSVILTSTLTVEKTIPVGLNPFGMAISPDGRRLYVAEYTSQKISIIDLDPDSGTADRAIARIGVESNERDSEVAPDGGTRIVAESSPRDVEVSPDGGTLFFTTEDLGLRYLVLDENGSADENAGTVRITKESSTRDVEVSPDGGVVWVTTMAGALEGYRVPLEVDGSYQAVARIGVESNSREVEVSPDGGLLYVTSFDLGIVQVYAISSQIVPSSSSATGTVFALTLTPVQQLTVGDNPEAVVFSAAAQVAIVVNSGSDDLTILAFGEPLAGTDLDSDGDGLTDIEEIALGTDPFFWDSDGDGLSDLEEVQSPYTDPMSADTDGDGLDDNLDPDADGKNGPDIRQTILADLNAMLGRVIPDVAFNKGGKSSKSNKSEKEDEDSVEDIIETLVEKIEANLDAKLWEENTTFPSAKRGNVVFNNDKNALKAIGKLIDLTTGADEDLDELATRILTYDFAIVTELLDDATRASCSADKKCRKNLQKADASLEDALDELDIDSADELADRDRSDQDKAVDDLRKAWQSAVDVVKATTGSYGKGGLDTDEDLVPVEFSLSQNYPNPFNPTTTIEFGLKEAVNVRLEVFDLLGRHVQTLVNGPLDVGTHQYRFDASRLASGMYLYRIQAGNFIQVKQMTILK